MRSSPSPAARAPPRPQEELPPQEELRIGGKEGFLPYRATATLLASALSDPPSLEEVSALRTPALDKFLPPRRRGPSPASLRRRIELEFVHCPIVDLGVPAEERWVGALAGGSGECGGLVGLCSWLAPLRVKSRQSMPGGGRLKD